MLIVLLRHGPAGSSDPDRWPDDRLRPLTEKGKERTLRACFGLVRLVPQSDAIYTSPLKRAAETAKLLTRALDAPRAETLEELSPGGSARRTIEALMRHRAADTIVLVGHEPDLGVLAGALCGSRALPLKKSGACAIETHGKARLASGVLRWMLPPAALRMLAKKKAALPG